MNNKNILIIFGIILLVLLGTILIISLTGKKEIGYDYFTIEPEPWIEEKILTDDDTDVKINVKRASRDKSFYAGNQQDYNLDGDRIAFFTHSYYKGNHFTNTFLGEGFYNYSLALSETELEKRAQEFLIMNIGPDMDPDDGIIDGFILGKLEDDEFVFYIFVDEDWKNNIEYTNIVYGDDFYDESTLQMRKFSFEENHNGIYIEKVEGATWFENDPVTGGLLVGEVNKKTPSLRPSELNSTFIRIG